MSGTEILVLVGGLALGYWVVSKLYDELFGKRSSSDTKPGEGQDSSDAK